MLRKFYPHTIWLLLCAGLLVRFFLFARVDFMFENDIRTFQIWGTQLAAYGLSAFYTGGMWSDYPPGYLYVLALIGVLRGIFEWELLSPPLNFFTFLPAILADVAIGYGVYRLARPRTGEKQALFFTALWLFNPAILLISSVWGQVESVFLLPLLISLVLLREKRLLAAYMVYGVAILIKPQSLFLGPVYLFSAFDYWRTQEYAWLELKRLGLFVLAAVGGMLVLAFPFAQGINYIPVFRQFIGGLDMYNFSSVNAFNFWALTGHNWQPLDAISFGVSHATWGVLIAVAIIAAIMVALEAHKRNGGAHYWLIIAAVFVLIFVFSVKMHERYLFPAMLFLLLYAMECPRRHNFSLYILASGTFYINCIAVLRAYHAGWDFTVLTPYIVPVGWANIGLAAGLVLSFIWSTHRKVRL
ncbi:MAG: hypothetical protein FWC16_11270 [Defluviitaleaceae bacterium]|nr:hypothetical protein [Defluviitaleaceae bacterium]MCL2275498.1 hypothetical protein [Defluviitaleaceae bacterium]